MSGNVKYQTPLLENEKRLLKFSTLYDLSSNLRDKYKGFDINMTSFPKIKLTDKKDGKSINSHIEMTNFHDLN